MSDIHKIFRVTSCGCQKSIKIKNNQINKKTNQQINILDPKYLSQIKSNIYKISRETFCRCPTNIKTKKSINKHANKNKQINILEPIYLSQIKSDLHKILRVSNGDPSATKLGPKGPPFGGRRPPALCRS